MCAFENKATTHSQFLVSDKFRVALRERTYLGHRQIIEICVVRCVAPFFVLTVGTSVGALMPMRMLRPSISFFRATGQFMFAGSRRLRFCMRKPLRFRLHRPANGSDVLAREGVGFEGRGIRNWQHAVIGDDVRHHMRPTRLRAAIRTVVSRKCGKLRSRKKCQALPSAWLTSSTGEGWTSVSLPPPGIFRNPFSSCS